MTRIADPKNDWMWIQLWTFCFFLGGEGERFPIFNGFFFLVWKSRIPCILGDWLGFPEELAADDAELSDLKDRWSSGFWDNGWPGAAVWGKDLDPRWFCDCDPFGMVKTWPFSVVKWPPTFGDEKVTLNHLGCVFFNFVWLNGERECWNVQLMVNAFLLQLGFYLWQPLSNHLKNHPKTCLMLVVLRGPTLQCATFPPETSPYYGMIDYHHPLIRPY